MGRDAEGCLATVDNAPARVLLIVEDDRLMSHTLRVFLQTQLPDLTILEACDGAQAMLLCARHRPRVVLMDVRLPDADGIDLTAKVKAAVPEAVVIIVSSHIGKPFSDRARAMGAAAYVAKEHIHRDLLPHVYAALPRQTREQA
jgi:DNA-binding NarL/FixJ family response regulator